MEEKRKKSSVNSYKVAKYGCILMVVLGVIGFLTTKEELFLSLAVLAGGGMMMSSDLSDKQYTIDCHYRTAEMRNVRISMLNEEKLALIEKIEECQQQLISETQQRASAERQIKRMKKQMEQAGILYVSSNNKRKDTITRKRRSKNNETNNKAN